MLAKKIISVSIIVLLFASGFLIITHREINTAALPKIEEIVNTKNITTSCSNLVEFNNDYLQLKEEAVQYKITFHQNDTVNVTVKIATMYVDETTTCVYFLLTDGEKPLLEPACVCFIPERKYLLVTPKMRFSIGKWWFMKIFKDKVGQSNNDSKQFEVQEGENWYLTFAVPTSSEKSYFSVIFKSLNESMEVTQLARHHNLGLYTPSFNQFSGRYYAIKLGFLGGASICDISKEITVKDGCVIHMVVAGQIKGNMMVYFPNGEKTQFNQAGIMTYIFLGNETGNWKFMFKGWSIYFRMVIVLFYIDIDPHIKAV